MTSWARAFAGEVVKVQRWSDTHVRSSGGGGYVDPKFGGFVSPPQIYSDIKQRCSIFVRDCNGIETEFDVSSLKLSFNEGNKVFFVWGSMSGDEIGPYAYVANYTTQRKSSINDRDLKAYKDASKYTDTPLLLPILAGLSVWLIIYFVFGNLSGFFFLGQNILAVLTLGCVNLVISEKHASDGYVIENERRNIYAEQINTAIAKYSGTVKIKSTRFMEFED